MSAKIIQFPKKYRETTPLGVAIKLYSEEEVEMVLFCLNIFGDSDNPITQSDLRSADPQYTLDCMKKAHNSFLLSQDAKAIISYIMKNVTDVTPKSQGARL